MQTFYENNETIVGIKRQFDGSPACFSISGNTPYFLGRKGKSLFTMTNDVQFCFCDMLT